MTDQDAVAAVLTSFDVRGQVALVTGAASLITGETVLVDGGWTAR